MKWPALLLLLPALSGCGEFPRDQAGTLDRVREKKVVRVGLVGGAAPSPHAAKLRALVERSAAAAGARPQLVQEASEPLLLKLEAGELDLVVGEFDRASPWYRRVHLLPPLARVQSGEAEIETTAAARNGENAWIMLVEREAKALSQVQ
jgi:hypothetical protein